MPERQELLDLVEAMPEWNRQALLSLLRRQPPDRPFWPWLSPLGPISADDAELMLRVVEEDRTAAEENLDWVAEAFDRMTGDA